MATQQNALIDYLRRSLNPGPMNSLGESQYDPSMTDQIPPDAWADQGVSQNQLAQALQQPMPQPEMNTMRNNLTGATYQFNSQPQNQNASLDYAQPIEIGGVGKGYRVKGDPFSVVLADGSKVSLGRDVEADRQSQKEDIGLKMARSNLQGQNIENRAKEAAIGAGRVPAGYRQSATGNLEAIPGGPADIKLAGQYNADTAQLQSSNADLDRLATSANEILKHPGLPGITGLRGALPNIPGTDAADAQAKLQTLKSQVGFGVLQAMRNASKTGGALGSVSDAEGKRLEANLAALDNAQSEKQFKESLGKIIEFSNSAKDRLSGAYNLRHGGQSATNTNPSLNAPTSSNGWKIEKVP